MNLLTTFFSPLRDDDYSDSEILSEFELSSEKVIKNIVSKEQSQFLMYIREVIEEMSENVERHAQDIDKISRNLGLMQGLVKNVF